MSHSSYDPAILYDEDEVYPITGKALNQISRGIKQLQKEIRELRDAEVMAELEMLRLRDKNPSLKDAWDKYQTVLKLASKE